MATVNQPTLRPTNKLTAATLGGALVSVVGLALKNLAPEWYDPDVILAVAPVATFILGYMVKDQRNV